MRRLILTVGVLVAGLLCGERPAAAQTLDPTSGHHYQRVSGNLTWHAAKDAAAALSVNGISGHLATITSAAENQFIVASFGDVTSHWLGGYQDRSAPDFSETGGGWRWITDETWAYTNWAPGEPNQAHPNEDFLEFRPPDGSWNDVQATWGSLGYIVEFDTPIAPPTETPAAVPEPGALALFLPALAAVTLLRRRRA